MRRNETLVYLAAPLFNEQERQFNNWIAEQLEKHVSVFLPQRNGALLVDMMAAGVPQLVAERRVFEQDRQAMAAADVLVAVLDGGHIDEGVAFEIGFMRALGKPSVGLQTDVRRALPTGNNPMIARGLDVIVSTVEMLVAWIEDFARSNGDSEVLRA